MRDTGNTSPAGTELLTAVEACLSGSGTEGWTVPFLDLVETSGAVQIMIFSYAPDRASSLLSRNFRAKAVGARLAKDYLDGWFRKDPLYRRALEMAPASAALFEAGDMAGAMEAEYRSRFFDAPGLSGKTAVLVTGRTLRLAVNFYWADPEGAAAKPEFLRLLARLALLHFEANPDFSYPAPLAVLSERERAVCLGMLSGKKAELIAADLGVAPSSVVTYRRRAYEKLGISSRGELFALCSA